jgi:hypothetical protein
MASRARLHSRGASNTLTMPAHLLTRREHVWRVVLRHGQDLRVHFRAAVLARHGHRAHARDAVCTV